MTRLNLSLWLLGLLLQGVLLAILWARRLLVRFRYFALLVGFYCCRSVLLVVLQGSGPTAVSPLLLTALALVDIALQITVAWQIFASASVKSDGRGLTRSSAQRGTLQLAGAFSMLVLLAIGCLVALLLLLPHTRRYQMDRGVLMTSFLFLFLLTTAHWRKPTRTVLRLAQGFAMFAAAGLAGQVGRLLAAAVRDTHAFRNCSYIEPVAYLLTVLFWLVALYREQPSMPAYVVLHSPPRRIFRRTHSAGPADV